MTRKRRVTAKEVRDVTYPAEKRRRDRMSHLWAYLVIRPLSFRLTPFFVNRDISANAVTASGLLVLITGLLAIFLAVDSWTLLIGGALLINAWYLLDFVDGNIARFQDETSPFGAYLDWYVGIVYHVGLPLVTGFVLATSGAFSVLPVPSEWWLPVAVMMVLALLLRKTVDQKVSNLAGKSSGQNASLSIPEIIGGAFNSFKAPSFFVLAILGVIDLWLLLYTLYEVASVPVQAVTKAKQLR